MSEEAKKVELPTHLDDVPGRTPRELLASKVAIIRDHGFNAWERLVADSRKPKR